eukprot:gene8908-13808_t
MVYLIPFLWETSGFSDLATDSTGATVQRHAALGIHLTLTVETEGHASQGLHSLVQLLLKPCYCSCPEPLLKKELLMTRPLNVVALSGGTWRPSRTLVLTQAVLAELADQLPIQATLIELGDIARPLGGALSRQELPADVEAQLQAIEQADLLIVAAPVYRGSYPGLLKHLFDLVDLNALINTPVLLAATGGSERHAL